MPRTKKRKATPTPSLKHDLKRTCRELRATVKGLDAGLRSWRDETLKLRNQNRALLNERQAAEQVVEIYFKIAAEVIGEDKLQARVEEELEK